MIVCASFPRSGNTFLCNSLAGVLRERLRFCEAQMKPFVPVTHNFVKTHDFDLNFIVPDGWKVVVQVREPCAAISSWFNVEVKFETVKDTEEEWRAFAYRVVPYWHGFLAKWIPKADLILRHEDFMRAPDAGLEIITEMMGYPTEVRGLKPRESTRVEDFQYYDEKFFNKLKMKCMRSL